MSEYGVELINDYSYKIATENDVNYVLRRSGVIKNSEFQNGGDASIYILDTTGMNAPLLFFKSDTSNKRIAQIPNVSNDGKRTSILLYKWKNLSVGDLQYYLFDRFIPPERSGYGIQIFNPSGSIIFDGGWNFLKLVNVIWLDTGFPNHDGHGSGNNWTNIGNVASGKEIAVSMPISRGYIYPSGVFGHMTYECIHSDTSNNIFCSLIDAGEFLDVTGTYGYEGNMKSQVMIADVSMLPKLYSK